MLTVTARLMHSAAHRLLFVFSVVINRDYWVKVLQDTRKLSMFKVRFHLTCRVITSSKASGNSLVTPIPLGQMSTHYLESIKLAKQPGSISACKSEERCIDGRI